MRFGGFLPIPSRTTPPRAVLLLALLSGNVNAETVKLSPQPVIADADFVAYDRTDYTLQITLKAAKKLVKKLKGLRRGATLSRSEVLDFFWDGMPDTPFVLTAFGRPVYVGVFTTTVSSGGFRLVPRVLCIDRPGEHVKHRRNVRLQVCLPSGMQDDPRVLEALRSLGP